MEDSYLRLSGKLNTEQQKRILNAVHPSLRSQLNVHQLIPYLNQKGMLTAAEMEDLGKEHLNRERKVDMLILCIQRKGSYSLQCFIDCLKNTTEARGHEDLVRKLENEVMKELQRKPCHAENNERYAQGM